MIQKQSRPINNIICNMYGQQTNPESPNRYAFLKQAPVNSNEINSNLGFLNKRLAQIKETDFKLKEGIQDTRNTLIKHLQPDQANQLLVTGIQVSNNKYPNVMAPQTTKNQYQSQRVIVNNFHTPVAGQSNADSKNLMFKKPPANFIVQPKLVHSQQGSPINRLKAPSQQKQISVIQSDKDRIIYEQHQIIQKLETQMRNIQPGNFKHKFECPQCKKYKEIIKNLEDKFKQVNEKAHNDSKQFLFEFKIISSERDSYKLKLAQFDKDKAQQLGNLQKIIQELRKRETNSMNQKSRYKYLNDSTKSENVTSLKLEIEELKYKNTHLNKKMKEKSEKLLDLESLLEQTKADQIKSSSVQNRNRSNQKQDQVLVSKIDGYNKLSQEYQHFKSQKTAEIGEIMKRFDLANQRLQEAEQHNQNMFHEINELNELVEEYREQNAKLKLLNQKYEIDLEKKEEQVSELHSVLQQFKQKNMETVSEYNQLVQKCELLEQKTKRLSLLETEVSSQVSGMRSHKHSEELWEKKQKQLLAKIQHLDNQIQLINRQKQAEIEERKVYETKSKELYQKIRELNQQNSKLRLIRDEDQKSEIVYFNKQKIDSLLSPNYSRANSGSSVRFNDREFLEKDKVAEKSEVGKHTLNLEEMKTKVEALMKKVQILGGHLPNQSRLLRQQSNKSKFKINQVQIPNLEGPLGSSSSRSKAKLHRNSQSNAQIQFTEQNLPNDPNYSIPPSSSAQILKVQNQIYGEWKEWSVEMGKISKQLQSIIEDQIHEKNILVQQIQELNIEKARIYASFGNSQRQVEKLTEENQKLRSELNQKSLQFQDFWKILKEKQQYDINLKKQNENTEHRSQQYRKASQKFEAEYEIAKTKLDVLEISNKQWEAHFIRMEKENLEMMNEIKELRVENLSLNKFRIEIEQKITKQNQLNFNKIKSQENENLELSRQLAELKNKIQSEISQHNREKQQTQEIINNLKLENSNLAKKSSQIERIKQKNDQVIENLVSQLEALQSTNQRIKEEHRILQRMNQETEFANIQKIKVFERDIAHLHSKRNILEENLIKAQNYIEEIVKENQDLKMNKNIELILEEEQKEIQKLNKQLIEEKAIRLKLQKQAQLHQKNILSVQKARGLALGSILEKLSTIEAAPSSSQSQSQSQELQIMNPKIDSNEKEIYHQIEQKINKLQNRLQLSKLQYQKVENNLVKAQDHITQLYQEIDSLKLQNENKLKSEVSRLTKQISELKAVSEQERLIIIRQFNSELRELENLIEQNAQLGVNKQIQVQHESPEQIQQNLRNLKNKLKKNKEINQQIRVNLSLSERKVLTLEEDGKRLKEDAHTKNSIVNAVEQGVAELNKQIKQQKAKIVKLEQELVENYENAENFTRESDRILSSIYEKLEVIDKKAQYDHEALTTANIGQIRQTIEKKVDELKTRLAEEQVQHEKAYESLSKAEDHILQLYEDIQKLKQEAGSKQDLLRQIKEQKGQFSENLKNLRKDNQKLSGQISKLSRQKHDLISSLKSLEQQVKELQQTKASWSRSQSQHKSEPAANQTSQSELMKLRNQLLTKNEEIAAKNQELFEELSQITFKYNLEKLENKKINEQLAEVKTKSQELNLVVKQNEGLVEQNQQLKISNTELGQKLVTLKNEIQNSAKRSTEVQRSLDELKKTTTSLNQQLKRQTTQKRMLEENYNNLIANREESYNKLVLAQEHIVKLQDDIKNLQIQLSRREKATEANTRKQLESYYQQVEKEVQQAQSKIFSLENALKVSQNSTNQLVKKLTQKNKVDEQNVLNLLKQNQMLKQEISGKEYQLKGKEQQKEGLAEQIKTEKEIILQFQNSQKIKDSILHSIYNKILGIEENSQEGSMPTFQIENVGKIEQIIEDKVDQLRIRLENQKIQHNKAYEGLSKAEDHILELYKEIQNLKKEASSNTISGEVRLKQEEKKTSVLLSNVNLLNQEILKKNLSIKALEDENQDLRIQIKNHIEQLSFATRQKSIISQENQELRFSNNELSKKLSLAQSGLQDSVKKLSQAQQNLVKLEGIITGLNQQLNREAEKADTLGKNYNVAIANKEQSYNKLVLAEQHIAKLYDDIKNLSFELSRKAAEENTRKQLERSQQAEDEKKKGSVFLEQVNLLNQEITNKNLTIKVLENENQYLKSKNSELNIATKQKQRLSEENQQLNISNSELTKKLTFVESELSNSVKQSSQVQQNIVELQQTILGLREQLKIQATKTRTLEENYNFAIINKEQNYNKLVLAEEHIAKLYDDIKNLQLELSGKEVMEVNMKRQLENSCKQAENAALEAQEKIATLENAMNEKKKELDQKNQTEEQKIGNLLKESQLLRQEISQIENKERRKSIVLNSVYQKLVGIEENTEKVDKTAQQPTQNIDQLIEQKVDELKFRLEEEKIEVNRVYDSLSKAEDHILELYADIQKLKQETLAKESILIQVEEQKNKIIKNLEYQERQNKKLNEETKNLLSQIQKEKKANFSLISKISDLQQKSRQTQNQEKQIQIQNKAKANEILAIKQQAEEYVQQNKSLLAELGQQRQRSKSLKQNLSSLEGEKQKIATNLVAAENYIEFLLKQNQDLQKINKLKTLQDNSLETEHEKARLNQRIQLLSRQNNALSEEAQHLTTENEQLKQIIENLQKNQVALCEQIGILNKQIDKLMQAIKQSQVKASNDSKKAEIQEKKQEYIKQITLQLEILNGEKFELKEDVRRLESFADQIVQENKKYRQENQALKALVEDLEESSDSLKEQLHQVIIEQAKCFKIIQDLDEDQIGRQIYGEPENKAVLNPHESVSQVLERNSHMIRILSKSLETQELTTKQDKQKYSQVVSILKDKEQANQLLSHKNEELQQKVQQLTQAQAEAQAQTHPQTDLVDRSQLQRTFNNLVKAQQYIDHLLEQNKRLTTYSSQVELDCQELNNKIGLIGEELSNLYVRYGMLEKENRRIDEGLQSKVSENVQNSSGLELMYTSQINNLAQNLQKQITQKLALEAETTQLTIQLNKTSQQNQFLKSELELAIGQKNAAINQIQTQVQKLQETKSKLETVLTDFSQAYEEESAKLNKKIEVLTNEQIEVIENYNKQIEENFRVRKVLDEYEKRQRSIIDDFDREAQTLKSQLDKQTSQSNLLREEKAKLISKLTEADIKLQNLQKEKEISGKATQQIVQQTKIIDDLQNLLNLKLIQLEQAGQANLQSENKVIDLNNRIKELEDQLANQRELNRVFMEESKQIKAKLEDLYQDRGKQLMERDTLQAQLNEVKGQLQQAVRAKDNETQSKATLEKLHNQEFDKSRLLQSKLSQIISENKNQAEEIVKHRQAEAIYQITIKNLKNQLQEQKQKIQDKQSSIESLKVSELAELKAENIQLANQLAAIKSHISQAEEDSKAKISEKESELKSVVTQLNQTRSQYNEKKAIVDNLTRDNAHLAKTITEIEQKLINQEQLFKKNLEIQKEEKERTHTLLKLKDNQLRQRVEKINHLESTLNDLAAKLDFEVKDKAEILRDTTQMWNDLQAAGQRILFLQSSLNNPNEQTRLNEEREVIQKLQADNDQLRQKISRVEEQSFKNTQTFQAQKGQLLTSQRELSQKLKMCQASLTNKQALQVQKGKQVQEIVAQKDERIKKLTSQVEKANNQLITTHNQLQLTHAQIENTMKVLHKIQNQFQILNEENIERQQKLQKADAQIKNLNEEKEQWKNKLSKAESHIAYQEQYIDEISKNEQRFIQSQQRCIILQNRIHELEEHLRELLSPEVRERIRSTDEDFMKVEEYFLKAIEDEKRNIYQKFIQEHPENKQHVKIDKGELIVLGGSQEEIKIDEINDLNQKIVEVDDKGKKISQSLNSLKDNELKLSFAEKKIKELQNELSRHQSKRTSLDSSLEAMEKNLKEAEQNQRKEDFQDEPKKKDNMLKIQEYASRNEPSPRAKSNIQQIDALRETVYEQQEKIAYLQQQLQNKNFQIQQLSEKKRSPSPINLQTHQASIPEDHHQKQLQSTKLITQLTKNINELSQQLAEEENRHIIQLKKYEDQIINLNHRVKEQEEKYQNTKALAEKLGKEQHVLKQNLSIVQGVRDQLAEENSMLAQQVTRYEQIITELQNKQTASPPKSARERIQVQALQAEASELRGRLQIMQQEKAQATKQFEKKLQASQQQTAQAHSQVNQLLKQKLILQDQLSQYNLQAQRSSETLRATQEKLEQITKEYFQLGEENKKLKENQIVLNQQVNKLEKLNIQFIAKEQEQTRLKEELRKVNDKNEECEQKISKLQTEKEQLKENYARLRGQIRKIEQQLDEDSQDETPIQPKETLQAKSEKLEESEQPEKEILNISKKLRKVNEGIKLQAQATSQLKIQNSQLISQNEVLKTSNDTLTAEVQTLNNNIKDFDGKMKEFQSLTGDLEKQLKDVYHRLSEKQRKDNNKHEIENVRKQNQELKDKIKKAEEEHSQVLQKLKDKISQLQKKQTNLTAQSLKLTQRLEQAEKKLEDHYNEKDVDQEIEKARLSLDEGFKKQKSQRRSSIDKDKLTDRDRINMLQRIIYQLEEQVKSFERSVENLTEQLSVYQDKEAEWVENQNQLSEIIDVTEKISTGLSKIKQVEYKQQIPIEEPQTSLPWLSIFNKLIKQTIEGYQKCVRGMNEHISSLKQLKSEQSISVSERQSRSGEKTPSNSSYQSEKQQQQQHSQNRETQIIEERYEELIKEYVSLENQNKVLGKEVEKLQQEVEGYKKKVAQLAINVVESSSQNKSQLQTLQLRRKLEDVQHQVLKMQGEKDVKQFLPNNSQDQDEFEPIRLRSRDFSEGSSDLITFLNNCLARLEAIQQNSEQIQRQCEDKNERLEQLIQKVRGQITPEVSSVRKSQQLVHQFRQLLYSEQQPSKQSDSNIESGLKLPYAFQHEEKQEESPEHQQPRQILQVPNQFSPTSQIPDFINLLGPININDRNQLIKQIKQLSDLMNLYHSQYENIKNKYTRNIKKLQSELNKVKDLSVSIVNQNGGEVVEGSPIEKLFNKVSDLVQRLNIEYNELIQNQDGEKINDLEIIQEDVQNQDTENKSISTPKSNKKDRNLFTPKSGYSSMSEKQLAAKYRDIIHKSTHTLQDIESNNYQCQTNMEAKPFIDYLLENNQFERAELLELKQRIAGMRSRQDKANIRYLEEREQEVENLVRFEKQRLPEHLKGNMLKVMEILALKLDESELKQMVELGLGSKIIDKVIEAINVETEEKQQFEKFFETPEEKQQRKKVIKQANTIRTKYYTEDNQFSIDILDCLIGFYHAHSDSEEFLIVVDKVFETIASMQKNMEISMRDRERLVEGHSQALKKILQKQWEEQQAISPNQSPSPKREQSEYELKLQQSHEQGSPASK